MLVHVADARSSDAGEQRAAEELDAHGQTRALRAGEGEHCAFERAQALDHEVFTGLKVDEEFAFCGGEVLVVDAGGATDRAILGGLIGQYARTLGIVALVVDGAVRDRTELAEGAPPVFARGVSHLGPYKDGPGEIRGPVTIGGVVIADGDLVIGDEDGIAVGMMLPPMCAFNAEVEPDPSTDLVDRLGALLVDAGHDGVIGLGGGSAMDSAKAAAAVATNGVPSLALTGPDKVGVDPLPVVAIPTTAGPVSASDGTPLVATAAAALAESMALPPPRPMTPSWPASTSSAPSRSTRSVEGSGSTSEKTE
ncbi:hypothetical protein CJ026_026375 [Ralstonia pickettii]|nr:hypothetical protein CJ026_026375 [Ralstonia pickettii]